MEKAVLVVLAETVELEALVVAVATTMLLVTFLVVNGVVVTHHPYPDIVNIMVVTVELKTTLIVIQLTTDTIIVTNV